MNTTKALIVATVLLANSHAIAQVTISASGSDQGGGTVYNKSDGIATQGQTFVTPDATNVWLNSFSMDLAHYTGAATSLNVYVIEWSTINTRPTGSALFTSNAVTTTTTYPSSATYTFNTGGLALDPAKTYMMLAFAPANASGGQDMVYLVPGTSYSGGQALYLADTGMRPFSDITTMPWTARTTDLVFSATFSAVPEPSTYAALAGLGVLACAAYLRRHRRTV